jgi:hypothetical protein
MDDELKRVWKAEIVTYFNEIYQRFSQGTEEDHQGPQRGWLFSKLKFRTRTSRIQAGSANRLIPIFGNL